MWTMLPATRRLAVGMTVVLASCAETPAGPDVIDRFDVMGTWHVTLDTYADCPTPAKLKYTLIITDKDLTNRSYGVDVDARWDAGPLIGWIDLPRGDVVLYMEDPTGFYGAVVRATIVFGQRAWFGDVIDAGGGRYLALLGSGCRYHFNATPA